MNASSPPVVVALQPQLRRATVRSTLEADGFTVLEAASADQAVQWCAEQAVAVCLLDSGLRGGSFAAARQILAARPQLPVIMLADPDTNELLRAVRLGVIGYLVKGIDDRTPTRVVRAAIAGEAVLPRRFLPRLSDAVRQPGLTRQVGGGNVVLSPREEQVADLLRASRSTKEIAAELGIKPVTARRHISNLLHKLGTHSRGDARKLLAADPNTTSEPD